MIFQLRLLIVLAFVALVTAAPSTPPPSWPHAHRLYIPSGSGKQWLIAATVIATVIALGIRMRRKLAEEWPEDSDKITDVEDRFSGFLVIPAPEPVEDEKFLVPEAED